MMVLAKVEGGDFAPQWHTLFVHNNTHTQSAAKERDPGFLVPGQPRTTRVLAAKVKGGSRTRQEQE